MKKTKQKINHSFMIDGRVIKVKCTKKELKKHIQKIKSKCKELEPFEGFKGQLN